MNKYHAQRTFSAICNRTFDSKAEAVRAAELTLSQQVGLIETLEFQKRFILSKKPKVTITIDFAYMDMEHGVQIYEDTKGVLTRDFRTKLAWLKEKYHIEVRLTA